MVRGLDIVLGLELFFDPSPRHPVLNPAGLELIPHGPGRCFSLYPFKGLNRGSQMHVSLQQTLTPPVHTRQSLTPHFRAWMDAMIGLVRKWTRFDGAHCAGWAA